MPKGLSGNQLKVIAMVTMTIDHIGDILFPQLLWLRLIGRLALPVYAFLIAEGCRQTRSMGRYLGSVALMALLCQATVALCGSWYQSILVTFSMSIWLIFLLQKLQETKKPLWSNLFAVAVAGVFFVTEMLPGLLSGTDYAVDYGFLGVMLPVVVWLMPKKLWQLMTAAVVLLLMGLSAWSQLLALGAVPLLALYNGQRGKYNLKWLFYWYYPVHLAIIHLIGMLWGAYL